MRTFIRIATAVLALPLAGGGVAPEYVARLRAENFRLQKVGTLDGNVGYSKFDNFVEPEFSKAAFTGAMDFLHHASARRSTTGGSPTWATGRSWSTAAPTTA